MPAVQPPSVYEVRGPSTTPAEGPSFPHSASGLPVPPSVIEDLSTRLGNLEYGHGQLVKKVIQVSDAEVAAGVSIGEIGLRVFAIEGQMQVMASQMVHATNRWEGQQTATQRDEEIAGLTQQGAGFAGSCAAERHTDSTAVDCSFRNEKPGEQIDAMHFKDG
ncbi:hypothetical protein Tco_0441449 [Tanacetum coccineum]